MRSEKPLTNFDVIAFVPIVDTARAKHFYRDTLGLELLSEEPPFALVFNANGIMLRLVIAKELPARFGTALGWRVTDITSRVSELAAAGVTFERYPGMPQDQLGIWTAPGGAKVAWFKDPDGNVLSISEHPEVTL
ncbi:MAG TPA: VOC family protein [Terriglobales bacterium]|nr:VOC family protein [Terriglobales bacterium]